MDLGATICTPKNPACAICPLSAVCAGRGAPIRCFPVKGPKPPRPQRRGAAFYILRADGAVLVRTRPAKRPARRHDRNPRHAVERRFRRPPRRADSRRSRPPTASLAVSSSMGLHISNCSYRYMWPRSRLAGRRRRIAAGPRADGLDAEALPTVMRKVIAAARAGKRFRRTGMFHVKQAGALTFEKSGETWRGAGVRASF